jgi:hypothetical protein
MEMCSEHNGGDIIVLYESRRGTEWKGCPLCEALETAEALAETAANLEQEIVSLAEDI